MLALKIIQVGFGCIIVLFFLSLCLYEDRDGLSWTESLNKVEHPTWKYGYVLCEDKTIINRGHELDKEYFELLELAERECSK
jgi:hypothetical protein